MRLLGLLVVSGGIALGSGCGDDDARADADTSMADAGADTDVGMTDSGSDAGDDAASDAGDSGDVGPDVGPADGGMCPDLMGTDPGELVISQIDVAGKRVEVYNPGAEFVVGEHQFCSRNSYTDLTAVGPSTIPARAYALYTLPPAFNLVQSSGGMMGGEIALYRTPTYDDETSMLDFVCWNGERNASMTRKAVAERGGLWTGECADPSTMDAVIRLPSTAGTTAADYDVTAPFAETVCE